VEFVFYDNLKELCRLHNIKITPLVLECGGTKGIIGGWKNGRSPNSEIVIKIAQKLQISTDALLLGNKDITKTEEPINLNQMEKDVLDKFRQLSETEQYEEYGRLKGIIEFKQKMMNRESAAEFAEEIDPRRNRATKTA
jgi:transcriptional regulator with XRE-family HTH domain